MVEETAGYNESAVGKFKMSLLYSLAEYFVTTHFSSMPTCDFVSEFSLKEHLWCIGCLNFVFFCRAITVKSYSVNSRSLNVSLVEVLQPYVSSIMRERSWQYCALNERRKPRSYFIFNISQAILDHTLT